MVKDTRTLLKNMEYGLVRLRVSLVSDRSALNIILILESLMLVISATNDISEPVYQPSFRIFLNLGPNAAFDEGGIVT